MRLVIERASLMKRSTPTTNASHSIDIPFVAASVAASVTSPPPVTAAAPLLVSIRMPMIWSCCQKPRCKPKAWARNMIAIER